MSASRVVIVIPVHNRRAITLACLRRLRVQDVLAWASPIVVDDGSDDGTGDAVRAEFPEAEVLRSEGNLFWTGAMELGMKHAIAHGAEFVFWLNDDCDPQPGALATLLATARRNGGAAGGVALLPANGQPIYAGYRKGRFELEFVGAAPGEEVACDALNGNLVCFARSAIAAIGWPDGRGLPQAFGDIDYTLRLHAAGQPVVLVGDARLSATPNDPVHHASWLVGDITVAQMWSALWTVRSYAYLPSHFRFLRRHWGVAGAAWCGWLVLKRIPITVLKLTVPLRWRRAWWGRQSHAWQVEKKIRAGSTPS